MKSVMVNQFKQLPHVEFTRSTFDTSRGYLSTMNAGLLYPVFYDEIYPGQTIRLNSSFFGRINTLLNPGYYNIYMDYHLWFIPTRLVWDNTEEFFGQEDSNYGLAPGATKQTEFVEPVITAPEGGFPRYGFADYLGVPPAIGNLFFDAKYWRAYALTWNTFYRSETLQDPVFVCTADTGDVYNDIKLLPRGKRFDYFTSALPEPQRGQDVTLPIGGNAPVIGNGKSLGITNAVHSGSWQGFTITNAGGSNVVIDKDHYTTAGTQGTNLLGLSPLSVGVVTDPANSGLVADLSSSIAPTLQSFRESVLTERFLERENRYGTRFKELIYGHFGTESPDFRLQLPEYLGGTTIRLDVSQVPQTSGSSDNTTPQGNLAAYGTLANTGSGFYRSFTEWGIVLGLVSFRTDLQYQQGVDRKLTRRDRFDYMWPEFAGMSDQAILNREIFAQGTDADTAVFGYQERFGELRYGVSLITGKMRSSDPQSLDVWHTAQYFENLPTLSSQFIVENPPLNRIVAVQDEPIFTLDVFHECYSTLPIPAYGVPGIDKI